MRIPFALVADPHSSQGQKGDRTVPYPNSPEYTLMVAGLIETGEPFGDVEDWIDELAELSADEEAALCLFAFSLRDPVPRATRAGREMIGHAHQRNRRDRLGAAVGQTVQEARRRRPVRRALGETADHPRPLELDVRGFPIARRSRTLVEWVARLLNRSHPETDEEGVSCPTSTAPAAG